jgi:diaminohydroxyphosphoribosylaminopyrimidine deaminase / 5-amino-6-(5-phosphoribosylamino)uracil reductase
VDAHDIRFLQHAITLARKGTALTSPNPMVGCVIVNEGQVVGEGFHQYEWRDHAEIVALKSAGAKAKGSTLYVSLEPCNHTGRTGPCSEAIIATGVKRVVAAIKDPNPKTAGRGFERLKSAGIEVESGALETDAQALIEAFACWIRTKRPFVTLKSALTLDGQLALPKAKSKAAKAKAKTNDGNRSDWITSEESRAEVQQLRHTSDALLTGIGTIFADNPLLTDRSGLPRRRPLLRVILDSKLRLSPKSRIVATADDDLLVFTAAALNSLKAKALQRAGVEIVRAPAKSGRIDLAKVLADLGRRDILSVLLEAGPSLNGAVIEAQAVDKFILYYAPKIAGSTKVPLAYLNPRIHVTLENILTQAVGADLRIEAYVPNRRKK